MSELRRVAPPLDEIARVIEPEHVLYDTEFLGPRVRFFVSGFMFRNGMPKTDDRRPPLNASLAACEESDSDSNLHAFGACIPAGYEKTIRAIKLHAAPAHASAARPAALVRLTLTIGYSDTPALDYKAFPLGELVTLETPIRLQSLEFFDLAVEPPAHGSLSWLHASLRCRALLLGPLSRPGA